MAGSSVTVTRTSKDVDDIRRKSVTISLACVSDDTNGTVPAQSLDGLDEYVVISVRPIPDAVAPPTSAYEIRLEDEDDEPLFLSGSIATSSHDLLGGATGSGSKYGDYPRMSASTVFKIVDPADSTTLLNIGNSKELVANITLEKK